MMRRPGGTTGSPGRRRRLGDAPVVRANLERGIINRQSYRQIALQTPNGES